MVVNNTKIYQKTKNKKWLSIEMNKKFYKIRKSSVL